MRPRITFMLGGVAILLLAGALMASAIRDTAMYYLTPGELAARTRADPSFFETGVKLGARVVPGSIRRAAGGREVSFDVTDGAETYSVIYRGIPPDTFTDNVDVVVEGRLGHNGTFRATHLFAKCGSRYESAPEKYKDTPGYRQATQAGA